MNDRRECTEIQRTLAEYAVQTLKPAAMRRVDAHLAGCESCRAALEQVKAKLHQFDALPDTAPERDLTAAVMARIERGDTQETRAERPGWFTMPRFAMTAALVLILAGVFIVPGMQQAREASQGPSIVHNLKSLALAFDMYTDEDPLRMLPALYREGSYWLPDMKLLCPKYSFDPSILVDPRRKDREQLLDELKGATSSAPIDIAVLEQVFAESYVYLGYAMCDLFDLESVAAARKAGKEEAIGRGGNAIPRLRKHLEWVRRGKTIPTSEVPVMFARMPQMETHYWFFESNPRYHVLFLDGHVELLPEDGHFLFTPAAKKLFALSE